jgi:cytochrome c-type protein NapB
VVGVVIRDHSADAVCRQCHVPGATAPTFVPVQWQAAAWPATNQRAMDGSPPLIPHSFQLRTNCVACHAGPAAVEEIRTTHPERANCRQCHVPAAQEEEPFTRNGDVPARTPGGGF